MYAWELEQTQAELRGLRHAEWEDTALAALAFGLALGASELVPGLAVPLAAGALAIAYLALRAFWRHWELVDRLLLDREAYQIREVRERAERSATMESRHRLAQSARSLLERSEYASRARVDGAADELRALARELDDRGLSLDPASAVACERFLCDCSASPLFNPALPADDAGAWVRRIRAGFEERGMT